MGLFMALLGVFSTAGVIYYMGKSGFKWGENLDKDE